MGLYSIFDIAGSGMSAQSVRLNTVASNMANVNSISSSINKTYRAREPVFQTVAMTGPMVSKYDKNYRIMKNSAYSSGGQGISQSHVYGKGNVGVRVQGVIEKTSPPLKEYNPKHPLADKNGFVYRPNVNVMEEMTNMISASKSYEMNVNVADSAKRMLQKTLSLGER